MSKRSSGFTLLELIVVLAGLGILSSLAIPNYIKYIDYARVDEAKSLLNNVAADCLRNLREDDDALTKEVDPNIISMSRLENTGYSFQVEENPTTEQLVAEPPNGFGLPKKVEKIFEIIKEQKEY